MMENTYNYDQPTRHCSARRFVMGFIIVSTIAFTIGLAIVFTDRLVFRPHNPQFRVDSFSISNFTVRNESSKKVSFSADVRLTALNPNKKLALSFDRVDAGVNDGPWSLGRTVLPPFWMDKKSQAELNARFAADGVVVGDMVERDRVEIDLKMLSGVRFEETGAWRSLNVSCGGLLVGIPSNGRPGEGLVGGPRWCLVG